MHTHQVCCVSHPRNCHPASVIPNDIVWIGHKHGTIARHLNDVALVSLRVAVTYTDKWLNIVPDCVLAVPIDRAAESPPLSDHNRNDDITVQRKHLPSF